VKIVSPRLIYSRCSCAAVSPAPIPAEMIEPVDVPAASRKTLCTGCLRLRSSMEGPCNNYASDTATVDGKGYIFSEGLHFFLLWQNRLIVTYYMVSVTQFCGISSAL